MRRPSRCVLTHSLLPRANYVQSSVNNTFHRFFEAPCGSFLDASNSMAVLIACSSVVLSMCPDLIFNKSCLDAWRQFLASHTMQPSPSLYPPGHPHLSSVQMSLVPLCQGPAVISVEEGGLSHCSKDLALDVLASTYEHRGSQWSLLDDPSSHDPSFDHLVYTSFLL